MSFDAILGEIVNGCGGGLGGQAELLVAQGVPLFS